MTKDELDQLEEDLQQSIEASKPPVEYMQVSELLRKASQEYNTRTPDSFVSYGYDFLDNHLGGINEAELVVIGAESGCGKTTFATNILVKASKKHKSVLFSLEDRPEDLILNRMYFKINELRKKDGKNAYPFIAYHKNEIKDLEFKTYQNRAEGALVDTFNDNVDIVRINKILDIAILEKEIEKKSSEGVKLFVIDHLHYFAFDDKSSRADAIQEFMNRLRFVQKKTGARVILIVHYRKLNGSKPTIDSFKDSMAISQNASVIINLWRDRGGGSFADFDSEGDDKGTVNMTEIMIPKIRIPVPEVTFRAEYDPTTNDYKDDSSVEGTEQGDGYSRYKMTNFGGI